MLESEAKYKKLIEGVPDLVWEFDENEIFTFCSESYEHILGYNPEELLGKSVYSQFDLIEVARPIMHEVMEMAQESVFLGVLNGDKPEDHALDAEHPSMILATKTLQDLGYMPSDHNNK